jgi:hypothetical protein
MKFILEVCSQFEIISLIHRAEKRTVMQIVLSHCYYTVLSVGAEMYFQPDMNNFIVYGDKAHCLPSHIVRGERVTVNPSTS